jgi:hypothetical protein
VKGEKMKTSEVARRIVENVPRNELGGIMFDPFYRSVLSELDALVASERERYAMLAESPVCGCKTEDLHDGCCASCGRRIAEIIRTK